MSEDTRWVFGASWWPPTFKLPVDGSLKNLDLDRDGKADNFQFNVKWPIGTIFRSVNLIERMQLEVDGESIPQENLYMIIKNQKLKDYKKSNLTFDLVETITIGAEKDNGLSPGFHEFLLMVEFAGSPGPAMQTRFSMKMQE